MELPSAVSRACTTTGPTVTRSQINFLVLPLGSSTLNRLQPHSCGLIFQSTLLLPRTSTRAARMRVQPLLSLTPPRMTTMTHTSMTICLPWSLVRAMTTTPAVTATLLLLSMLRRHLIPSPKARKLNPLRADIGLPFHVLGVSASSLHLPLKQTPACDEAPGPAVAVFNAEPLKRPSGDKAYATSVVCPGPRPLSSNRNLPQTQHLKLPQLLQLRLLMPSGTT